MSFFPWNLSRDCLAAWPHCGQRAQIAKLKMNSRAQSLPIARFGYMAYPDADTPLCQCAEASLISETMVHTYLFSWTCWIEITANASPVARTLFLSVAIASVSLDRCWRISANVH